MCSKQKSTPRSDTENILTILAYLQTEWQFVIKLLGFDIVDANNKVRQPLTGTQFCCMIINMIYFGLVQL